MIWVELIGYCGTALTVVAYAMRTSIRLRVAGILSSVAFLVYGYLTASYPVMVMEMILLPLNALRLVEMLRLVRAAARAGEGEAGRPPLHWLAPYMSKRRLGRGEALCRRGEAADALFVLVRGTLRNPETGERFGPGRLVGDALPFDGAATQSATLVAEGEATVGALPQAELSELCFQNPAFGYRLARLLVGSMRAEIDALRARRPAENASRRIHGLPFASV